MSHEVETMFYVREKPWHNLGIRVEEALTSADALKMAGLDWEVTQSSVYAEGNVEIPNYKANVRSTDKAVLGVVSDRYCVMQNHEAFAFTDKLIGTEIRYETAGSLYGGRRVWMLAKMPNTKILGDEVEPYLCFTNSHDGSSKIKACMTPVRVVCNNTLNLAFKGAKRQWATKHTENMNDRIYEAKECLGLAEDYINKLGSYAEKLANKRVKDDEIQAILAELFPYDEEKDSDRLKVNMQKCKDEFMTCYYMTDLSAFIGTAWGVVNAASDMITHNAPRRQTENYRENNWGRIMDGHAMLDRVVELVGVK